MDRYEGILKAGLFIVCALGYGFIRTLPDFSAPWLLLTPILLGMIYFVLKAHDWPTRLVPWMCACIVAGMVAGHWWSNSRNHIGPVVDGEGWFWLGLAVVCFSADWWRSVHGQNSNDVNPKSS